MNRVVFVSVLVLSLSLARGSSAAAPHAAGLVSALRAMGGPVTVPPEWQGIWTVQDSVYDCMGNPMSTSTGADTLCTGDTYDQNPGGVQYNCSTTINAGTVHWTCNASIEIFTDCKASYAVQGDGTRTGDSYVFVSTSNVTYTGTGFGCNLVPQSCTRIVSRGTRTDASPTACLTPAQTTTWGRLKVIYR